jgi:hypothetical protein
MTLTAPESEISDLKKIINDLINRIDNLEIQINYFNKSNLNQWQNLCLFQQQIYLCYIVILLFFTPNRL